MISVIVAHHSGRSRAHLVMLENEVYEQLNMMGMKGEFLLESRGSISHARNVAARRAQGNILVFLDDDLRLRRGFMEEILAPFSDQAVGVVGGVNLAFPEIQGSERVSAVLMSSPLLWFRSVARYTPRGGIRETDEAEIVGCCLAILKKAFDEAGGFPLDVIPCEENVLINRIQALGWKVIYNPFAIVFHRRAEFPGEYARKIFHYGTGRGIMMRQSFFKGSPRSFWKPSRLWILYFLGFWIHHFSYFAGVFYGYFVKKKYHKRGE